MSDTLRHQLEDILAQVRLLTFLQPVADLHADEMFGYEAHTRLPLGSAFQTPAALAEAARTCGLLGALDWARIWLAVAAFVHLDLPGRLFVSVSAESLVGPDFQPEFLVTALRAAGLAPERLVLEIADRAAAACDVGSAARNLRAQGVQLAVADAGDALQPLAAFAKLHVGRLTAGASVHPRPLATPRTADCAIIARGLESVRELEAVNALGIRYAQGRLIGDPSPVPMRHLPGAVQARLGGARPRA